MKVVIYDEQGNFVEKIEFITCINTYNGYVDNSTNRPVAGYTDKGIYPLTDDLVYIMQTYTSISEWNDATSPNYLFTDMVIDTDTAWMFPVCYDAERLIGGKKNPYKVYSDSQITLPAGESYTYVEEGFEAVAFGLDCSDKVQVKKDDRITVDASGNYVIPAQEGVYTITYTVDNLKFGGKLGGEKIQRIRVFTVDAAEEDGRNG